MSSAVPLIQDPSGEVFEDPHGVTDWLSETTSYEALLQLEKYEAEQTLRSFIELMWTVLEPSHPFVGSWCVDAVSEFLEAVTRGEIKRGLMNVPPGFMKSLTTSVFWPAWEWGPMDMPSMRYVCASYAEHLTIRDNRKCRQLIQAPLYRQLWGDRFALVGDQNAKTKFENDHTGWKMATGVTGVGTGERGDRFVIDDPHNVKGAESEPVREGTLQWFTEVVPSRVNDLKKSAILVIMQRVHERDVSGLILAEELGYEHLMIPMEFEPERKCWVNFRPSYSPTQVHGRSVVYNENAHAWQLPGVYETQMKAAEPDFVYDETQVKKQRRWAADPRSEDGELAWPERFPREELENDLKKPLRAWGGEYAVAGQLQQRPAPRGGGMFKRVWLPIVPEIPAGLTIIGSARGWDLAATDDDPGAAFTVGGLMHKLSDGRYLIADIERGQLSDAGVMTCMRNCAVSDGKQVIQDFPQDPGQAGKAQVRALVRNLDGYPVKWGLESGDKTLRARPLAAQAEIGNVLLLKGSWNKAFLDELVVFPVGKHKDQVDAVTRAYNRLSGRKKKKVFSGGLIVGA